MSLGRQGLGALLGLLVAVGACRSPCQDVCVRMAEIAEEDCGLQVPDGEVDTCIADQAGADAEDSQACADYGSADAIRSQWDCEDLGVYWGGGGT